MIKKYTDFISRQVHAENNTWTSRSVSEAEEYNDWDNDKFINHVNLLLEEFSLLPHKVAKDRASWDDHFHKHRNSLDKLRVQTVKRRDTEASHMANLRREGGTLDFHLGRRNKHPKGSDKWNFHHDLYSSANARYKEHVVYHRQLTDLTNALDRHIKKSSKETSPDKKPKVSSKSSSPKEEGGLVNKIKKAVTKTKASSPKKVAVTKTKASSPKKVAVTKTLSPPKEEPKEEESIPEPPKKRGTRRVTPNKIRAEMKAKKDFPGVKRVAEDYVNYITKQIHNENNTWTSRKGE